MPGWAERLQRIGAQLDRAGLDVRGVLTAAAWDARVAPPFRRAPRLPAGAGEARVWILGAGRALFAAVAAGPDAGSPDPLDRHTARVSRAAARALGRAGARSAVVLGHEAVDGVFPDLVAAAEAAGLGWPSRLGLLLHPERGPWWSLRAAILTEAPLPPGRPREDPAPCRSCDAPCTRVCPGAAPQPAGFLVARCAAVRVRREAPCALRCDARRACPVGGAHAYAQADEARLMAASRPAVCARAPQA